MAAFRQEIRRILACPTCHADLDFTETQIVCRGCGGRFPIVDGIPHFAQPPPEQQATNDYKFQSAQMFDSTLTARLFNRGKRIVNCDYVPRERLAEFLGAIQPNAVGVELGSGNRRLHRTIVNLDLFVFPNVDLQADVSTTPVRSESVDYAVIDSVLEHVPNPRQVVLEIHRILRSGGQVYAAVPWVFPYHGYPRNYCHFSECGLEALFCDFAECRVFMRHGPTSAFLNIVSEYVALALSGNRPFLYTFFKGLTLLPLFPLKYLDWFWARSQHATRLASTLSVLARK
jgi:uncharacterized protein YbaR (Trm112 family)/SAM-dependent methyltransferase